MTSPAAVRAATQHFSIIANFGESTPNAAYTPYGGVYVDKAGDIFGTTLLGGTNAAGTVFKLTPSGKTYVASIAHDFKTKFDGQSPGDHPIEDGSGNLFVTAQQAGPGAGGTGIELSPNGNGYRESGLASIPDSTASFVLVGKTLFVTSPSGGANGCGAIYELTGSNGFTPTDVYDFCTTPNDGVTPDSALVADSTGALYGTATNGGTIGSGTVFKFIPKKNGGAGTLTNLYNFDAFTGDGRFPYGSVTLDGKGNIYGTTQSGGSADDGTIFRLSPGKGQLYVEKILHSFVGTPDAENPTAGLALIGSKLYGTTNEGGKANFGAVYTVDTSGSLYSVVHSFAGGVDGQYPAYCPLFVSGGALFGTTSAGGAAPQPQGTVFEYVP